jgi:pimeloyl-ACP methyl ester carboxylesterase
MDLETLLPTALLSLSLGISAGPVAAELTLTPCRLTANPARPSVAAECAQLSVPLDPNNEDGPQIELFVARVAALSAEPSADPLTLLAGGPGQAATTLYPLVSGAFERIRRNRDIILVDQRGTGRSEPLNCTTPEDQELEMADAETVARITRECLADLEVDARWFTTSVAVSDLDRVRRALGIEQWNVYGASYGTRVAQHYARQYPTQTRAVILDGIVPATVNLGPQIAAHAETTLQAIFTRCREDQGCNDTYGDVNGKFRSLVQRLEDSPITLNLRSPLSGEVHEEVFTVSALKAAVRLLTYSPDTAALLPLFVQQAYEGDWNPLAAQAFMIMEQLEDAIAYGMHNSVVCAEDVPFFAELDREAMRRTYLGTTQVDALQSICEDWPRGPIDDNFKTPLESAVPALLLSGEFDPITPPAYGSQAAAGFSNSRHVVVAGQGHGMAMIGCVPRLMAQFLDELAPETLDTDCVDRQRPAPFFLTPQGPTP